MEGSDDDFFGDGEDYDNFGSGVVSADFKAMEQHFYTVGFKEGVEQGTQKGIQRGFDQGYAQSKREESCGCSVSAPRVLLFDKMMSLSFLHVCSPQLDVLMSRLRRKLQCHGFH